MSTYKFSTAERAAIYSTHGEKCYLCNLPLNLKTMEVDHVIPESLIEKPKELQATLNAFGLPSNFDLNSFANWLPACRPCNGTKNDLVFEPTPIIQVRLQRAIAKAADAQALAAETVSKRKITNALIVLERARDDGILDDEVIQTLSEFISQHRQPDLSGQPILLTPLYEIITEQSGIQLVRGPYGVGGRSAIRNPDSSFCCPCCGSIAAWNGSRCVICGQLNDE
ncbi:HNH endonuclease signature motif containing protein [Pseudomonas sp. Sample_20]|uniref:HNH endonuclease n=1 Tax=Pseudomonas sp. Sample_20 TaxID=2448264 RepID=UPI001032BA5C|nr:HNH endonuclease signature motif containing protein [Pseudomonas sp. Sample_20]